MQLVYLFCCLLYIYFSGGTVFPGWDGVRGSCAALRWFFAIPGGGFIYCRCPAVCLALSTLAQSYPNLAKREKHG